MRKCRCAKCISLCLYRPGWFLPNQIELVAEYMQLNIKELFNNYLVADHFSYSPYNIFVLAPSSKGYTSGCERSPDTTGECIFFNSQDKSCKIDNVKPYECIEYTHDDSEYDILERRRIIAILWKNRQNYISKLISRDI